MEMFLPFCILGKLFELIYAQLIMLNYFYFSSTQGSFLYDISISPADDSIYMTNSESHQVWRILKVEDVESPLNNWEVVAGTGERCVPGDLNNCGDGVIVVVVVRE